MDRTCTHFDLTEADLRKKNYDSENESISTQLKRAEVRGVMDRKSNVYFYAFLIISHY